MYVRLATLVAITGVLLAASGCGKEPGGTGSLGEAPSAPTEGASTPAGDPATPAPEPSVVQAKWFLQVEDLGDSGTAEILPSERVNEARINPCAGRLPSDDQRLARAAAHVLYRFNDIPGSTPDGTAYEVITLYRSGGAAAFLADLRAAVERCPTATRGETTIEREIAKTDFVGDQSILVLETAKFDFEGTPRQSTSPIAAIRLGERILLLDVSGWEGTDVTQAELDRLINAAITRAAL